MGTRCPRPVSPVVYSKTPDPGELSQRYSSKLKTLRSEDDVLKFDEEAAEIVLERSRRKAVHCSSVAPETPQTEGEVYVTFDGPKGRSVEVKLSVDFQVGSDQGQRCIKNAFMGEYIPPFEGTKTITYKLDLSKKD